MHISTILVGGTGVVYAVMRYLMDPVDSFSVVNHPWQSGVQHLHVLVAPLTVFAFGLIWRNHVFGHYRRGLSTARRSGISLMLTMVPMAVSGYLIQVSVVEFWRDTWIIVHCIASFLWLTGYLTHQVIHLRRKGIRLSEKHLSVPYRVSSSDLLTRDNPCIPNSLPARKQRLFAWMN